MRDRQTETSRASSRWLMERIDSDRRFSKLGNAASSYQTVSSSRPWSLCYYFWRHRGHSVIDLDSAWFAPVFATLYPRLKMTRFWREETSPGHS